MAETFSCASIASKLLSKTGNGVACEKLTFAIDALSKRPEPADAAWCGLSIHHLSTEGKRELLKAIQQDADDL